MRAVVGSLLVVFCLLLLSPPGKTVPVSISDLYIGTYEMSLDRVTLWSASSPPKTSADITLYYSQTWRYTLPGALSSAYSLSGFRWNSANKWLSYEMLIYSHWLTTEDSLIKIVLKGLNAEVVTLSFTTLVVTRTSNFFSLSLIGRNRWI